MSIEKTIDEYNAMSQEARETYNKDFGQYVSFMNELWDTDYIIIKIAEAEALGDHDEAERIRRDHAADIERRAALRRQINTIKEKWEGTD